MTRARANGRTVGGQFATGNPGGPGRPRRQVESDRLIALNEIVTPEAWERVCRRALQQAENGNPVARAWLADYLMGRAVGEAPALDEVVRPLATAEDVLDQALEGLAARQRPTLAAAD